MNPEITSKFNSYMLAQKSHPFPAAETAPRRALAISRETGAGSLTVAQLVTEILEVREGHSGTHPWAIFERNLVQKVLREHLLPESTERYLPETAVNRLTDYSETMLGLHPSSSTLVQKTNQTILRLAAAGNAILVGRGAHLVTARLAHVMRVRLIAPVEFRIRHIEEYFQLSRPDAIEYVRKEDRAKKSYLRRNFGPEAQNPLQFHLTVNTGLLGFFDSANLIAEAILNMESPTPCPQPFA